jgi:hypothetical protein
VLVRRIYPVRYETARLLKIVAAGAVVFAGGHVVGSLPGALIWKSLMMAGFIGLMVVFRFLDPGEIRALAAVVGRNAARRGSQSGGASVSRNP